ncbi:hypothetical protein S245_052613, partial [Arachis hypogaea]
SKHEPDGRVILVEFETLRLLNTYVPNNGWKEEPNSFQRRRKWDKRILEFVTQNSDKPLIWCGDLNFRREVDVRKLDMNERQQIVDKIFKVAEEDNEKYLIKFRNRLE